MTTVQIEIANWNELPSEYEDLSDRELVERRYYRARDRRRAWDAGRALSKKMLSRLAGKNQRFEILSRDCHGSHVRPNVFVEGQRLPLCLSLSHQDEWVAVAISQQVGVVTGIDLVEDVVPSDSFVDTWFTMAERRSLGATKRSAPTAWAIKEAVYKALNQGESFAPRRIEVLFRTNGRHQVRYFGVPLGDSLEICIYPQANGLILIAATVSAILEQQNDFATIHCHTGHDRNSLNNTTLADR